MSELTPYDTGAVAEPKLWPGHTGKVDFDNDEASTLATVWLDHAPTGDYVLHVESGEHTQEIPLRLMP